MLIGPRFTPKPSRRINWQHKRSRGLVYCALMNEGGGTTIYDLTQNNPAAIFNSSPTWNVGNTGPALNFNGTSSYVDCGRVKGIESVNGLSVFASLYPTSLTQNACAIAKWLYQSQGTFALQQYQTGSPGDIRLFFATSAADSGAGCNFETNTQPLKANRWQRVGFTFDGFFNGNSIKIYHNGISQSGTLSGGIPATSTSATAEFIIGQFQNLGRFWPGLVAVVYAWNRTLTPAEAYDDYVDTFGIFVEDGDAYFGKAIVSAILNRRTLGPRVGSRSIY